MRLVQILCIIFLPLLMASCENEEGKLTDKSPIIVRYYMMPRHANYDPFYNAVYEYHLKRRSVFSSPKNLHYGTYIDSISNKDSLAEYYYGWQRKTYAYYKQLTASLEQKENDTSFFPSILISFEMPDHEGFDTLTIDPDWNARLHKHTYAASEELKNEIANIMPCEMWMNWKYDLPGLNTSGFMAIPEKPEKRRSKE